MCEFCKENLYIKTQRLTMPVLAPITYVQELQYELLNKTGTEYVYTDKIYCHICGEKLK